MTCLTGSARQDQAARVAAGSPGEAIGKTQEDGWSTQRFRETCAIIGETLAGHGLALYEGKDGYAPTE